ncbi:acyl-CoA thioesterase [Facilibium subflavum]|uniref:acyl-CoA thioesterase n=1 Tax=Facilibium subflavum TaxID=2219058 RepID=UPI000E659492|nr:acyl-CoA thioesterase [Facilibium subflavum]
MKLKRPEVFVKEDLFYYQMPVRALDMNMGNHVSNDLYMVYITETISQFLMSHGYRLNNIQGQCLVFKNIVLSFKREIVYPDSINIMLSVSHVSKLQLTFYAEIKNDENIICALSQIDCAFINPQIRRPVKVPDGLQFINQAETG